MMTTTNNVDWHYHQKGRDNASMFRPILDLNRFPEEIEEAVDPGKDLAIPGKALEVPGKDVVAVPGRVGTQTVTRSQNSSTSSVLTEIENNNEGDISAFRPILDLNKPPEEEREVIADTWNDVTPPVDVERNVEKGSLIRSDNSSSCSISTGLEYFDEDDISAAILLLEMGSDRSGYTVEEYLQQQPCSFIRVPDSHDHTAPASSPVYELSEVVGTTCSSCSEAGDDDDNDEVGTVQEAVGTTGLGRSESVADAMDTTEEGERNIDVGRPQADNDEEVGVVQEDVVETTHSGRSEADHDEAGSVQETNADSPTFSNSADSLMIELRTLGKKRIRPKKDDPELDVFGTSPGVSGSDKNDNLQRPARKRQYKSLRELMGAK